MYLIREIDVKANKVWIDHEWVCISLEDERQVRFPIHKNKKLASATLQELEQVELICEGTGLHWKSLDEDLSVVGIMEGRFG